VLGVDDDRSKPFVALYERDHESNSWLVRFEGLEGCHTYGRTRLEARHRVEEALALWLDREPGQFTLDPR
jgi:predicted RNase H-like HicB family nuclease